MSDLDAISEAPLDRRVVLLAVADAADRGETPANQVEVRAVCNERLANESGPVVGRLSEADVARALNTLEADGLVENVSGADTTPVGKGRPRYEPGPAVGDVVEALATDEQLARLVDGIFQA